MQLIKIIRASVKKNPNAGRSSYPVFGSVDMSFTFNDNWLNAPVEIQNNPDIIWSIQADKFTNGVIATPAALEILQKTEGFVTAVKNNIQMLHGLPESKWLYAYENPLLTCSNCQQTTPLKDIPGDYFYYDDEDNDEEIYRETCPHCGEENSFPEVEYEDLEPVLKELGLK